MGPEKSLSFRTPLLQPLEPISIVILCQNVHYNMVVCTINFEIKPPEGADSLVFLE